MKTVHVLWGAVLGLSLALGGCASDCHQTCSLERECLRSHLDVDACTNRCDDRADRSSDYAHRTHMCAECMAEGACSELFNRCLLDCIGVVGGQR